MKTYFATQALSQTQKNVSEPQTGIEPATFWSHRRLKTAGLTLNIKYPHGVFHEYSLTYSVRK